jgi:hypothetical protein
MIAYRRRMATPPSVLVLTPVKDAAAHLDQWVALLEALDHPREALSVGALESDSADGTWERLTGLLPRLDARAARVTLMRHDFGFRVPHGMDRWAAPVQLPRRVALAKSRNRLLQTALRDETWVLWVDVDLEDYPPDVLARLLATGRDIVQPHCVLEPGGPTFDWNAWRDQGRVRMDALRDGPEVTRLDAVGGTMLLVRADLHRDGLVFPPLLYGRESPFARDPSPYVGSAGGRGEVETEGLALMARDMGVQCWGMPNLEIVHRSA